MAYKYLACHKYDLLPLEKLAKDSLFFWRTGGKGNWEFIVKEEFIPPNLKYHANWECDKSQLIKFLKRRYSDTFLFLPELPGIIHVPEHKMGWAIGKKGWRIKEIKKIFNSEIKFIPVLPPSKSHWWWGYGRNNLVVEKSSCCSCKQLLDDTTTVNDNLRFRYCNKCNIMNYTE